MRHDIIMKSAACWCAIFVLFGCKAEGTTAAGGGDDSNGEIRAFNITAPAPAQGIIDAAAKTITISVTDITPVTGMTAFAAYTGAGISPDPAEGRDYSSPVTYTITANNGVPVKWTVTVQKREENSKDLLIKFGIKESGYTEHTPNDVTAAFRAIHAYLVVCGGSPNKINLGDYIDLPFLSIPEVTKLGLKIPAVSVINKDLGNGRGTSLRLIVAGKNSFNGFNGNGTFPHLVFQFLNAPSKSGLDIDGVSYTIKKYSKMPLRHYLINEYAVGLRSAGVPIDNSDDSIVFAPLRSLVVQKTKASSYAPNEILSDKVWLPSEWEMTGKSYDKSENAQDQARLEYYDSLEFYETSEKLKKYSPDDSIPPGLTENNRTSYWLGSPCVSLALTGNHWGYVIENIGKVSGQIDDFSFERGIAPAFCVR